MALPYVCSKLTKPALIKKEVKYSLIIAITYLFFGVLWILISDSALELIINTPERYRQIQSIKGVLFVALSTAIIFSLALFFYKRNSFYQNKLIEMHLSDRQIFNEFPIGLAIIGLDNYFIKSNKSLAKMLGYSEKEMKEMSRYDVTCVADYAGDEVLRENLISGKETVYDLKKKLLMKSGNEIWCRITVMLMRDARKAPKYFIVSIENIHKEVLMTNELEKLNHELLEAQEIGNFGHWSFNLETNEFYCSDIVQEMLEIEHLPANAVPGRFYKMLGKSYAGNFRRMICNSIRYRKKLNTVVPIRLENERIKHVNIEAAVVFDELTQTCHLKGTIKDVTDNIMLYEDRAHFIKNVISWGYMLSHELRRPLCSLLGLLDLFMAKQVSGEEQDKLAAYLKAAGTELDDYTRKLARELNSMENRINQSDECRYSALKI
jgi:PAS domain S-box-containing protein